MKELKCRAVGGAAFPNDFNWECPTCKHENRAFQLPRNTERITLEQLEAACENCSHEAAMVGHTIVSVDVRPIPASITATARP